MKIDRFLRDIDGNVLAVVTLTVSAIFGTIGLTVSDESFDAAPPWSASSPARAVTSSPKDKNVPLVARKDATGVRMTGG